MNAADIPTTLGLENKSTQRPCDGVQQGKKAKKTLKKWIHENRGGIVTRELNILIAFD